jgi:hypothetical protein
MEDPMGEQINWEENLDAAKSRAQAENKVIFLDFYNPG